MKLSNLFILLTLTLIISCKPAKYANLEDGLYANLETNKGEILLNLEFDKTPITVASFVSLAKGTNKQVTDSLKGKPYFDGIVFHRVVKDFVIQGGDPSGTGSGGPGYKFSDEFPKDENGNLLLKHEKAGILSMANSGPASNGSQFFITHRKTSNLDGKHTVFGNVVNGQNVVDSIAQNDVIEKVEIVKIGKAAKKFKAANTFDTFFDDYQLILREKEERKKNSIATALQRFEEYRKSATDMPSGLKMEITNTLNGDYPKKGQKVKVHYAGYFPTGKLFASSYKEVVMAYGLYDEQQDKKGAYAPFETIYGPEARLIPGFKEGLQQLRVGDKAILFVPSFLGYAEQGFGKGMIPPNSDLIFEMELVEIVK